MSEVVIFLCTYQGMPYLEEQLESFSGQTHTNWKVLVSDDGSYDGTRTLLEAYLAKWDEGRLTICSGPKQGFCANFLSLVCKSAIESNYYAFSDQDDIWEPDRLERALAWLQGIPRDLPALYCSATTLIDCHNKTIGFSPIYTRTPGFANALVQNIGGGNTMVFNNATRRLLVEAGENLDVVSHDWWTYMLVSGCGGRVFYDTYPSVRYRQHKNNLVGSNSGWPGQFVRLYRLWRGRFKNWNNRNLEALESMRHKFTFANQQLLQQFSSAREKSLLPRMVGLKRSGIYRQTTLGDLGLIFAALFNKL